MWKFLSIHRFFYFFFMALVLRACYAAPAPVEGALVRESILNIGRLHAGWVEDVTAAYDQHDPEKQFKVGSFLLSAGNIPFVQEGVRLLDMALHQGIHDAGHMLGMFFLENPNPQLLDVVKGVDMLRNVANQGHMESQVELGLLFQRGVEGIPVDLAESCRYFMMAGEQGDLYSQMEAAYALDHGLDGVPQDLSLARYFYGLAYDQHQHPEACQRLVDMYLSGEGGPQDLPAARNLLQDLIVNGVDEDVRMSAHFNYGVMCLYGEGGPADFPEAEAHLMRVGPHFSDAYVLLGDFYAAQDDWRRAYLIYGLGADAGNADSMIAVARLLEGGRPGVPFNEHRALHWYRQALGHGVEDAFEPARGLAARLRRPVIDNPSPTKRQKR